MGCKVVLNLIVEDKNESTTGSSDDVWETSLEESSWSFISEDLLEAVHGTIVKFVSSSLSWGHHESTSNGIKWVRCDTSSDGDTLGEEPLLNEWGFLVVCEELDFTSIVQSKVWCSVHDDTNNWDTETVVELWDSTVGSSLGEAVNKTTEFSFSSWTDISSKSCSCEIKWVNEAEGCCTSSTTRSAVTDEEFSWVGLWVVWTESLLVEIFACKVQCLSWEVTDNVGKISSPEWSNTLFRRDSSETVSNTIISLINWDIFVGILNLKKELYSLDWSNQCLWHSSWSSSYKEIYDEILFLWWGSLTHISYLFAL